MKILKSFSLLLIAALVCSCSSTPKRPGPAVDGYCVTCYFTEGKAVKGSPAFSSTHAGETYLFDSQKSKDAFDANPEKYLPQYDAWCAYGVTFSQKIPVDPTVFAIVDDKLYLNKDASVGKIWNKDPEKYIAKADAKWPQIK